MKITVNLLKEVVAKSSDKLIGKRINKIVMVNNHTLLLTISELKEEKFIINLVNQNPYVSLVKTDLDIPGFGSNFVAQLVGKNAKPLITNIEVVNEDKIVKIETTSTDQYYHRNKHSLYIELIPSHPNIILTDENNKIIIPFYAYPLSSPRPMMKDLTYTLPTKGNENVNKETSYQEFNEFVNKDFLNVLKERHHEIFGTFIKKNKHRIKSLTKKKELIKETEETAKKNLNYVEIGNALLMYEENSNREDINKELGIELDNSLSLAKNAEKYFAKYKKAKRTLENIDRLIKDVDDEIFHLTYLNNQVETLSEDEAEALVEKESKKRNINIQEEVKAYQPYKVTFEGTTYYFGKNRVQNDYLSFSLFAKTSDVTWMHAKDISSSHLIINKGNPSNKEIEIGASILLLASKLTDGEVMVAKRKDIYRGNELGKAEVLSYETYKINKINEMAKELIKNAKK